MRNGCGAPTLVNHRVFEKERLRTLRCEIQGEGWSQRGSYLDTGMPVSSTASISS